MKQGDTAPKATADLNANLTGATVRFSVSKLNGTPALDKLATVTDAVLGLVEYQWVAGDLAVLVPGAYRAEFVVTFADARVERFPQRFYLELLVKPKVPV